MVHVVNNSIFIAGDVPSSKNSKVWTGKFLVNSKASQRYRKLAAIQYANKKSIHDFQTMLLQVSKPYKISFLFVRETKRKFDYVNMAQIVQDMMVEYKWIEDDNCEIMIPHFEPYLYNKQYPGVHIRVLGADLNRSFEMPAMTTNVSNQFYSV